MEKLTIQEREIKNKRVDELNTPIVSFCGKLNHIEHKLFYDLVWNDGNGCLSAGKEIGYAGSNRANQKI